MLNAQGQRLNKAFLVILMLSISSYDVGDDEVMEADEKHESDVGLAKFSGKYRGTWSWDFGTGTVIDPISMEIAPSTENQHIINFYESDILISNYSSNTVTPEATGTINISDSNWY